MTLIFLSDKPWNLRDLIKIYFLLISLCKLAESLGVHPQLCVLPLGPPYGNYGGKVGKEKRQVLRPECITLVAGSLVYKLYGGWE